MKNLALLLALLFASTAIAQTPPPVSLKGQSGTKLLPKWNLQVPYKQATNLGGIDALIETGNNNLLANPGFEAATFSECSTYNDGDVAVPVDGTGGTATGLTLATQTSTLGFGAKELKLSKDASSRRGTGFSCAFTVPAGLSGNVVRHFAQYSTTSAYADYAGATPGSDVGVYLYDVTNSALIYPSVPDVPANASGQYINSYQLSSNSTSFRLIYHIQTTNASAWDLITDEFFMGRQILATGPVDVYLGALTTTGSWVSNTTYSFNYWRRGDRLIADGVIATSGAPTSTNLNINLPSGLAIDSTKTQITTDSVYQGGGNTNDSGSAYRLVGVRGSGTATNLRIMYLVQASANWDNVAQNAPFTFGSGDTVYVRYEVPIAGWSTSQAQSQDGGTRQIVFKGYRNAALNVTTGAVKVSLDAVSSDTASCYDSGNGRCSVQESGYYDLIGAGGWNSIADTGYGQVAVYVNGSVAISGTQYRNGAAGEVHSVAADVKYLNKGDYVELYSVQNDSASEAINTGANSTYLVVAKRSSPQNIGAAPYVGASYVATSAVSNDIPTTTAFRVNYNLKLWDSHNAVTTGAGTWQYACPLSGKYRVSGMNYFTSQSWTAGQVIYHFIRLQGTDIKNDLMIVPRTATDNISKRFEGEVDCNFGQIITVITYHNAGSNRSINSTTDPQTYIEIERIN